MFEKLYRHEHNHSHGPRESRSENFKEWHAMREKPYVREQARKLLAAINQNSLKLVKQ